MDLGAARGEHLLEGFCLIDSTGKTVENHALGGVFGIGVEHVLKHTYHEVVGDKLPFGDVRVGNFAEFCAARDMIAEHLAGGDMVQAVL